VKKISIRAGAFWLIALIAATIVAFSYWCLSEHAQQRGFLSPLQPFVTRIVKVVEKFWGDSGLRYKLYSYATYSAGALIGLLAIICLCRRKLGIALFCFLALAPCATELLVLTNSPKLATYLYPISVIVIGLFFLLTRKSAAENTNFTNPIGIGELIGFLALFAAMTISRYYMLNTVPVVWDTELCNFRYTIFTSFWNVMRVEASTPRHTSLGMSWTFIYWLFGHLNEPDLYYLYQRLIGTAISITKFGLMYVLIRYLSGPIPALFGAAALSFGPPENWWSREPCAHQIPGLVAVLILLTTARAFFRRRWRDFLLASLVSALARITYASGLFLVFAPIAFFMVLLVFRWSEWKRHFFKIASLLIGIAIWLCWTSFSVGYVTGHWSWVSPLAVPPGEATPGGIVGLIARVWNQTLPAALSSIFLYQVNGSHWTVPLTLAPLRSTTSAVLILSVIGIARMVAKRSSPIALLLFISILLSLVPGITTAYADRRIGAIFVVLIAFAAHELHEIIAFFSRCGTPKLIRWFSGSAIVIQAVYLGWITTGMQFINQAGVPAQVPHGRLVRAALQDETLMVYLPGDMGCDTFMSVLQELLDHKGSIGWTSPDHILAPGDSIIVNPKIYPQWIRERNRELSNYYADRKTNWKAVRFLFTGNSQAAYFSETLKKVYPEGALESAAVAAGFESPTTLYTYTVSKEIAP
jgi:hypothetical protein